MASDHFIKSRERGKPAQKLLANILRSYGLEVYEVPDGYFPGYDLKLSTGKTVEVKYDIKAIIFGNICMELDSLDHSEADVIVYAYGDPIQCFYCLNLGPAREFAHKWPYKKNVGEFQLPAAIVKRQLFLEYLKPEVLYVLEG